ncbi:NADH-ubiquinone oxidoreductase-F iron-sulfur binding region domain-containing protein [Afifella pfennigii]|uniref:NADH-ubiquinone oxidoreductase-F iron-sulfur binding region domain-containing protein n=1 Tax=Afifella pfennigii TaxID=209897 RepID=UPI000478C74D|nr:NADH-ubiquinone oxidoreductase-F iron-sulfur binding region domain-containing protein [Afifella pfennigii]
MDAPSGGRRRKYAEPKGRQLDETALAEMEALIGEGEKRRDLLIEFLHLIQDRYGHLSARHLRALAQLMRLSQAEIYEVASFYYHFDIVKEGEAPPPPVTLRICDSISCMLAGAEGLIAAAQARADPARLRVVRAPCMGRCAEAPAALLGRRSLGHADAPTIGSLLTAGELSPEIADYVPLTAYREAGGYSLLAACRAGQWKPVELSDVLEEAGLRGLGGAGFPAGRKSTIVRSFPRPRYVTVNGDEGEPGTFKDRHYLETDPHRMLEGALIAAWAVEAERVYIYMRDEYPGVLEILAREIAALEEAGIAEPGFLELRRGAGAYVCGEESAMLESIEGKRGLPRHRPPYIAEKGLFARPTLNHNVETLWWVRDIIEKGGDWFAEQGRNGSKGLRSYSVSGRVAEPGVKVAPAGITLTELVAEHCGGMAEGHELKAFLPGGASGGIFPANMADTPLDFGKFDSAKGFIGSHAIVVLSQEDNIREVALNLMRFFAHESCGQCTPCRSGTEKLVQLLKDGPLEEEVLRDLEAVMRDASICGLGQAAPNPVNHLLTFFREDI